MPAGGDGPEPGRGCELGPDGGLGPPTEPPDGPAVSGTAIKQALKH